MSKKEPPAPEFSRVIEIDKLGTTHVLEPNATECAAICKRLGLESLESFTAKITMSRIRAGEVLRVAGHISAKLAQPCVVTLEPVPEAINEEFELLLSEAVSAADFDPDSDDFESPEPLEGTTLDLGEIAVQYLALALDPYPRKPGVEFAGYEV